MTGLGQRTDNERNHGGSISTSGFKTLDQLLDLPDLDILLSFVRRRSAHLGEATVDQGKSYRRPCRRLKIWSVKWAGVGEQRFRLACFTPKIS